MTDAEKLALIWDERAITKTMLNFGRALDTGDWPLYRSTFTDLVLIDFKRLTSFEEIQVDADDWTRFAELILSPVRRHHVFTNFDISVDGDKAFAIVYMTARHWKSSDLGASEYNQHGWYDVYFTRVDQEWKINRIKHDFQWVSGNNGMFDMTEPKLAENMKIVFCDANRAAAIASLGL
ncbi:nuclear transport factor 2 family protein [Sphingomonas profundi]|uniref:nuclear transport factor 2 family protein n=1 Tax=Alterirhizorhabdus profundi TaxID=2681549 RepID=UPI0012E7128A|nr:nuclear transport factor 2 family protein [Sphingomonas profundi]